MARAAEDEASTHVLRAPPATKLAAVDLEVIEGPDRGARHRLQPGVTRVGTAPTSALRLNDPSVSRLHAEIHVEPDGVRVVDLGSTNGTSVDTVDVRDARIASGSVLRLGGTKLRATFGRDPLTVVYSTRDRFGDVLGSSLAMRRVYEVMERVAPSDTTVLIRGETGTGKDLVARALHESSKRNKGPFVAVDCGAIAENLIESELFGHVRGAFTGAVGERVGLLEQAHGGTLFLDEIGELPLSLQPKLLRALESREVRRVGGNTSKKVDVRVMAATNRPLGPSVNRGSFRDDLYYRLAVVEIHLPALRERPEDVPVLAQHFLELLTGSTQPLPREALAALADRDWPGNVRELRNFVERSACLGWSTSATTKTEDRADAPATHLPIKEARIAWLQQFEHAYLVAVLDRAGGNVTRAAKLAGLTRRSMHRLLAEHGIRGGSAIADDDV